MCRKILVYIEKDASVSTELAMKSQELALALEDAQVVGLAFNEDGVGQRSYFDKIYFVNDDRVKSYSTEYYAKIAVDLIKDIEPEIVLIGATTQGRDLAPQIASELRTGLTADCTGLDINEKGRLAATRPTFGGKLMATILSKNNPQMATVRPKVITTDYAVELKDTEYVRYVPQIDEIEPRVRLLESVKKEVKHSLDTAEIIVAAGRGVKDNLDLIYEVSEKLNAKVGVSRAIVDLGLADSSIQVGQTGKTVAPKLYIACGISGAIQHTVGIMGAKKIIAINKDKDAPIFKVADYGIVGDCLEILPELIKEL